MNQIIVTMMVFLLTMVATAVAGDYYKWVDTAETVHVSDSLAAVPPEYRNQIEPMRLVEPEPSPATATPEVLPPAVTDIVPPETAEFARFETIYEPDSGPYVEVIKVPALVNDRVLAPMFVDTGSDVTVISFRLARRLGLFQGKEGAFRQLLQTTGGTVSTTMVILDKVEVAGAVNRFVPAVVVPSLSSGVDGLLGMGFLSKFNVQIDTLRHSITFLEHPVNEEAPDGRNEEWWRDTFKKFAQYRTQWKRAHDDVRRTRGGLISGVPYDTARASVDAQYREAEKLYAKLNRYAIQHDVPMEWRQ